MINNYASKQNTSVFASLKVLGVGILYMYLNASSSSTLYVAFWALL